MGREKERGDRWIEKRGEGIDGYRKEEKRQMDREKEIKDKYRSKERRDGRPQRPLKRSIYTGRRRHIGTYKSSSLLNINLKRNFCETFLIGFSKRGRKMERHRRGERDKQKNVKTERWRDRQEEKQNTNWLSDWETEE